MDKKIDYKKIGIGLGIILAAIFGGTQADLLLGGATDDQYEIVSQIKGYYTKSDPTNTPPEYLVSGSQNVIINDLERVETRAGYALLGAASTTATAITSDYSWKNSTGGEILLRQVDKTLYFYSASSTWENLYTGLHSTNPVRYAPVWTTTELQDALLFVNASSTIFEWSGGQSTVSSVTSNTIVLADAASSTGRFLTNGTRSVRIKDDDGSWNTFAYTGQSASTLTGVTPDPTSFSYTGAFVIQEVRLNKSEPFEGYVIDVIKTLDRQVFLGSNTSQEVYVSSNLSFTDYSYSSPRIAGEGAFIVLDGPTIGFEAADEQKMIVFSSKNKIYQIVFEISPGSSSDREVPHAIPLLVAEGQGAKSQELIGKAKQTIIWVNNNNELVELGQVENLPSPQTLPISDPIKPDFVAATFTNGEVDFWRNYILVTAPTDGKVYIYDSAKRFWQPPQIIGVRRLSVYTDLLYGHSNSVPDTYQLFTGTSDNGNPIAFKAHFAYRNSGQRAYLKQFNRLFTELYIGGNATATAKVLFEWQGAKSIQTYELDGSDQTLLFTPVAGAALGVNPLGTNPLGGTLIAGENTPKYRRFKPIVPVDYFEYQLRIESDSVDDVWQVLATGSNTKLSKNYPVNITK